MADETNNVSDAVSSAVKTVDQVLEDGGNVSEATTKDEPKKGETKKEDPDGFSDEEVLQSRQLYKALKDPEKAPILLKFFAEQAGYSKVETKQEGEEVKDEILTALEEHLGDEFGFLSSKLSKALDKIIKTKFDEHSREIKVTLEQQQYEKLTGESVNAYTELSRHYFNKDELPDNVSKKMSTLMDKYKPSAGTGVKEYLNDIFHMAASQLELNLKSRNAARVERNRGDAISRLAGGRGVTESTTIDHSKLNNNKSLSITDAIKLAKEQVEEQLEKK